MIVRAVAMAVDAPCVSRVTTKGDDMRYRVGSFILLIYILVGIYVAWVYDYLTPGILRDIAEALLSIFLWFLVLLGVDLHIGK
ncbi:hypothetical protein GT755_17025 [Herbidospora sp. NEAU-GS84]|uniref:Uncharacterized protein n=1 Tax=Herbidospora solisilvae TaxID=2696284 RepID=A0A7C9NIG0_9ACTN|nr:MULTISPECIES: hypothetical protein [Herbidospora]NAS23392.1 hypothetical protein [Herbidospora solisilvae]